MLRSFKHNLLVLTSFGAVVWAASPALAQTGSCCYGVGTPIAGCIDSGVTLSDCEFQLPPHVFTPGGTCSQGCPECLIPGRNTDELCNDGDPCTHDDCAFPPGICTHPPIAGFDGPGGTNCCDPSTGAITVLDDGDDCTADSCSSANNRGLAVHDAAGALGDPCDDGDPCSVYDRCDGVNSEADGGCIGTPVNGLPCGPSDDCTFGGQAPNAICTGGLCTCTPVTGAVCGNNTREGSEQCDGTADAACPDECGSNCRCPGGTPAPAMGAWGMGGLALLLLSGVALKFGHRRATSSRD